MAATTASSYLLALRPRTAQSALGQAQDVLLELAHCLCSDVGSRPLPHCAPPSSVSWQATALLFAPLPLLPCAFLQPRSCRRNGCQLWGKVVPLSWDLLFQEALQPGEQLSHRSCHLAQHLSLLEPRKGKLQDLTSPALPSGCKLAQNHRIRWVGRDIQRSSRPTPQLGHDTRTSHLQC